MIVFGCTFNPLQFVEALELNDIRYTIDRVTLNRNTIIFTSLLEFAKRLKQIRFKRVIVFDAVERLETIQGIRIKDINKIDYICNYLLNNRDQGQLNTPIIKSVKPIHNIIAKNKSMGIMHEYNTLFYNIPKKSVRDDVKTFVIKYMQGSIEIEHIDNLLQQTQDNMRQSKMRDSLSLLLVLLKSEVFITLRQALCNVLKMKGPIDRTIIELASSKHGVEPYDLHYFFSVVQKQKRDVNE